MIGGNPAFGGPLSAQNPDYVSCPANTLYAPIPYQNGIIVTYNGSNPQWYNIQYQQYPAGTQVTSFTSATPTSGTNAAALANANQALSNPAAAPTVTTNQQTQTKSGSLAAGQYLEDLFTGGSGAVRQLQVTLSAANMGAALQNTYLQISCDNQRTVYVPVGMFFGTGPQQVNSTSDYYTTVNATHTNTMTSYWTMPYQNATDIRLVNLGSQAVTATLSANSSAYAWTSQSMYFHADYRAENNITAGGYNGSAWTGGQNQDWNYVRIQGQGVYVGDTLAVTNTGGVAGQWWGEGDDKIWVDSSPASGVPSAGPAAHSRHRHRGRLWLRQRLVDGLLGAFQQRSPSRRLPRAGHDGRHAGPLPGRHPLQYLSAARPGDPILGQRAVEPAGRVVLVRHAGHVRLADHRQCPRRRERRHQRRDLAATRAQWQFLGSKSVLVNTSSGQGTAWNYLGAMTVGNTGNTGLGSSGNGGYNFPAVGNAPILTTGTFVRNDDVSMYPGGTINGGTSAYAYAVDRWVDTSTSGTIDINGSIRNLQTNSSGVNFYVLVNGVVKYSVSGAGAELPQEFFDVQTTVQPGSTVDFVLGASNSGALAGDESDLDATISVPEGIGAGMGVPALTTYNSIASGSWGSASTWDAAAVPNALGDRASQCQPGDRQFRRHGLVVCRGQRRNAGPGRRPDLDAERDDDGQSGRAALVCLGIRRSSPRAASLDKVAASGSFAINTAGAMSINTYSGSGTFNSRAKSATRSAASDSLRKSR